MLAMYSNLLSPSTGQRATMSKREGGFIFFFNKNHKRISYLYPFSVGLCTPPQRARTEKLGSVFVRSEAASNGRRVSGQVMSGPHTQRGRRKEITGALVIALPYAHHSKAEERGGGGNGEKKGGAKQSGNHDKLCAVQSRKTAPPTRGGT